MHTSPASLFDGRVSRRWVDARPLLPCRGRGPTRSGGDGWGTPQACVPAKVLGYSGLAAPSRPHDFGSPRTRVRAPHPSRLRRATFPYGKEIARLSREQPSTPPTGALGFSTRSASVSAMTRVQRCYTISETSVKPHGNRPRRPSDDGPILDEKTLRRRPRRRGRGTSRSSGPSAAESRRARATPHASAPAAALATPRPPAKPAVAFPERLRHGTRGRRRARWATLLPNRLRRQAQRNLGPGGDADFLTDPRRTPATAESVGRRGRVVRASTFSGRTTWSR